MRNQAPRPRTNLVLILLGTASAIIYGLITVLSHNYYSVQKQSDRPLLTVLFLFGATFLAYLLACCAVWRPRESVEVEPLDLKLNWRTKSIAIVIGFGIVFRIILLFSIPIQEIDLYRYVLDGVVGNAGGNPYEFAPSEIVRAIDQQDPLETNQHVSSVIFARPDTERAELQQLARSIVKQPGLTKCVKKIHYGDYTSPYPPVSQIVFRAATFLLPDDANEFDWLLSMKATLVIFDIVTGLFLISILGHCRLPAELGLWYWWCPLLLKEIANSGHLDSISICLTTIFAWLVVKSIWSKHTSTINSFLLAVGSGFVLGLAVAAKIYPVVLAPVWTIRLGKRFGIKAIVPIAMFCCTAILGVWPIVRGTSIATRFNLVQVNAEDEIHVANLTRQLNRSDLQVRRRPEPGIEMFSRYWEMNDLVFMFIVENLRPNQPFDGTEPWFLITSDQWRRDVTDRFAKILDVPTQQFPFQLTRRVTLAIYGLLVVIFCVGAWKADGPPKLLTLFFFSIAWFWLLSPTQNPWYWLWALPFLVFVNRPIPWLLMSGLLFLYYLRFYFQSQFPNANDLVAGTNYSGQLFFDFIIPWIEFGPVLLILFLTGLCRFSRVKSES